MLDKLKFYWSKTNRWHRVIFLFLVIELKLVPGGKVGFQCNDPALSHPFTGDTISWKWLLGVTVLLPLAVMLFVERQCANKNAETGKRMALRWYKEYIYGVLLNLTVIQTLKLVVGSPRPHFFDTCQPKEALTCVGNEYVSSYTCTKAYWLSQSDKSFPSGHTSLALHTGLFIVYYLHRRASDVPRSNAVLVAQLVCILTALYCSVSRIWDHRHHWWDVLAGAIIAAPILFYTVSIE
ncbi:unnamed protein product [Parnassius apollo]|uniref:(apollo) hypothetical protein n=1 Tax=Parnassius apollo TaxID=110799 RepID=A0A8S3XB60_PARAO|nr:unnamed protein product [Parnassius apollo]